MNLQELLKAKGLDDELIKGIQEDMKANKLYITNEENLDIRYNKLKTDHDNLTAQHGESTKLIEQFKASAKDNEALQGKITTYETTIADLSKQLKDAKIDAAMDRKLISAGAKPSDLGYLKFKWREKGDIDLDEHEEIKGGDDAVAGLKTQCAAQFNSENGGKEVVEQRLPTSDDRQHAPVNLAEAIQQKYENK